jgi:hypothetical protein
LAFATAWSAQSAPPHITVHSFVTSFDWERAFINIAKHCEGRLHCENISTITAVKGADARVPDIGKKDKNCGKTAFYTIRI